MSQHSLFDDNEQGKGKYERERTDRFAPSRLALARKRRGLFKKELAERINVSNQAITGFEDGSYVPSWENIQQISFVLQFPISFFFADEVNTIDETVPSFRSRRSMTATVRDKVLSAGQIATLIISPEIRRRFDLPQENIPDLPGESPEDAALFVREAWKLGQGPIHNVVHLLEAKGIETYWLNEPDVRIDAFSLWRDARPYIFLNLHKGAGDRSRFDAAHELGHLVLHRYEDVVGGRDTEREADEFASAFLLPASQYKRESPKSPILRQFFPLKQRWKVSISALVRRSRDLGVLSEWQYKKAYTDLSRMGWRVEEPIAIENEHSRIHELVFLSLVEKGIAIEDFAKALCLTVQEVYHLMPVLQSLNVKSQTAKVHQKETLAETHVRKSSSGKSYLRLVNPD